MISNRWKSFTFVNFDEESGISLAVGVPLQGKKWTSQDSLSVNYDKVEDFLAVLKKSTPYVYFSTNNTMNVWKYLSILRKMQSKNWKLARVLFNFIQDSSTKVRS